MQVLLIGIILTLLDIAVARYQLKRTPKQQQHANEDRWAAWPL